MYHMSKAIIGAAHEKRALRSFCLVLSTGPWKLMTSTCDVCDFKLQMAVTHPIQRIFSSGLFCQVSTLVYYTLAPITKFWPKLTLGPFSHELAQLWSRQKKRKQQEQQKRNQNKTKTKTNGQSFSMYCMMGKAIIMISPKKKMVRYLQCTIWWVQP